MAFFKFRKGGQERTAAPPESAPESLEAMRKRARHRLIGSAVLVLLGVIGFPLLFDSQPRPVAVDIPIEIPDKNSAKPLEALPAPRVASTSATSSTPSSAAPTPAPTQAPASTAARTPTPPAAANTTAADAKPASAKPSAPKPVEAKPAETKPAEAKPSDQGAPQKPAARTQDGARAQALLEGKDSAEPAKPAVAGGGTGAGTGARTAASGAVGTAASAGRYIVQVGAYAEVTKAREVRLKVEKAGIKTYTQVVQSPEGRRIRVRVGPFATKAEADKAAETIRKLDLPAALLEL